MFACDSRTLRSVFAPNLLCGKLRFGHEADGPIALQACDPGFSTVRFIENVLLEHLFLNYVRQRLGFGGLSLRGLNVIVDVNFCCVFGLLG